MRGAGAGCAGGCSAVRLDEGGAGGAWGGLWGAGVSSRPGAEREGGSGGRSAVPGDPEDAPPERCGGLGASPEEPEGPALR
ncbi:hypothetical protein CTZ27_34960 [Streptomyces griseocarneus]|nr:hypothetical protein CTZ27_34960 [Streptomyces griseocarneus]